MTTVSGKIFPSGHVIAVALGGNLGGTEVLLARFGAAITALSTVWGPATLSSWYKSRAVGEVTEQADFINGVAVFCPDNLHTPQACLRLLQAQETLHHRVRGIPGGPRTLDLDLLFCGLLQVNAETLQLPHPRIAERAFVLRPLLDVFGPHFRWSETHPSLKECLTQPTVANQSLQAITLPVDRVHPQSDL